MAFAVVAIAALAAASPGPPNPALIAPLSTALATLCAVLAAPARTGMHERGVITTGGAVAWDEVGAVRWRLDPARRTAVRLDVIARRGNSHPTTISSLSVPAALVTAVDDLLSARGFDARIAAAAPAPAASQAAA